MKKNGSSVNNRILEKIIIKNLYKENILTGQLILREPMLLALKKKWNFNIDLYFFDH